MTKFWKSVYCVFEAMGRARAAAVFAREGKHELAKRIMTERCECC